MEIGIMNQIFLDKPEVGLLNSDWLIWFLQWKFFLPAWNSHCTRVRFTVTLSCINELAVHSCPLLCLQRRVAKVASGLFCCWSLLRNNNMATNLQRFTSYYGSRRFVRNGYMRLLNAYILAVNAAGQWHANSGRPRAFILCEKKHEWIDSKVSTSLKNPLLVQAWPLCLSVILNLCRFFSWCAKLRGLSEYIYAGLWDTS